MGTVVMVIDQQDRMMDKATKEDRVDVQISIRKVKDRALVAQLMIKRVKVLKVAAQIRERALVAQTRERALVVQTRERALVVQIKDKTLAAQIRVRMVRESKVRMVRESKVAVQNLRKTSLVLKKLINS